MFLQNSTQNSTNNHTMNNTLEESQPMTSQIEHSNDAPRFASQIQRKYGWFGFTPSWLQWMHRPIYLFFTLASATFAYHSGTMGIFNAIVGTLVRRYGLSFAQIGMLSMSMNILSIVFIIIAAHYGENGHKGKWLAWSFILYAVGAFAFTIPQWISPLPISRGDNQIANSSFIRGGSLNGVLNGQLCNNELFSATSKNMSEAPKMAMGLMGNVGLSTNWANIYFWMFLAARLIQTIAASTTPLKLTYLDENVEQKNSAIFITALFLVPMASSGIGMVFGGMTLKVHADSYRTDVSHVSVGDKDWYGAWWIGYLCVGVLCLLSAIPMFGFAQDLPGKAAKRQSDIDQTHRGGLRKVPYGKSWSDFPRSLAIIIQNPVFTLLIIRNGILISLIVSLNVFMTVILREAFGMDESSGSMAVALCWLLPGMIGSIVGAAMIKYFRMQVRKILIMSGVTIVISKIFFMAILYHCPTQKVAGVNAGNGPFGVLGESLGLVSETKANLSFRQTEFSAVENTCNANCGCSAHRIKPACDTVNGVLYHSPCLAGCAMQMSNKTYANCKCLADSIDGTVAEGRCPMNNNCKSRKYVFLVLTALASFTGGIGGTPSLQAGLRSVPFEKRTLALGIQNIGIKVLVIPGPIIMGALMDQSCLVKMSKKAGKRNACFQYDATSIGNIFAIFSVISGIIATILIIIAILLYSPPGGEPWYKYCFKSGKKSGVAGVGIDGDDDNPSLKNFDHIPSN